MSSSPLTVWVAGTSSRTVSCLHILLDDARVRVTGVLTPAPKTTHKGLAVVNPVHELALKKSIQTVLVTTNRIDSNVKNEVQNIMPADILLVVDFGYFVPTWLLKWPNVAPINIHPSTLPRWRGSSPGQFVLLYGEQTSAISIIIMNEGLDTGPIISQIHFKVEPNWDTADYYQHAFSVVNSTLVDTLLVVSGGAQSSVEQPEESPTPIARKLCREDGFIEWRTVVDLLQGALQLTEVPLGGMSQLLIETQAEIQDLYQVIANASRAFSPWPGLWTIAPTTKGEKRLKLLSVERIQFPHPHLHISSMQIEGQRPATMGELKTLIPDLQ